TTRSGGPFSPTTDGPTPCSCMGSARRAFIAGRPVPAGVRGATASPSSTPRNPPRARDIARAGDAAPTRRTPPSIPGSTRCAAPGITMRYTIVDSPLGRLLVAATDRGVCAVSMGSSDQELERALSREYPEAVLRRDGGSLARWTEAILSHLAGRQPRLDLPLD